MSIVRRVIQSLAWAWVIVVGYYIITPGGVFCIVCGFATRLNRGDPILGSITMGVGVLGLVLTLTDRGRFGSDPMPLRARVASNPMPSYWGLLTGAAAVASLAAVVFGILPVLGVVEGQAFTQASTLLLGIAVFLFAGFGLLPLLFRRGSFVPSIPDLAGPCAGYVEALDGALAAQANARDPAAQVAAQDAVNRAAAALSACMKRVPSLPGNLGG